MNKIGKKNIKQGHLGIKTGKGFYTYPDPGFRKPEFLQGIH
jgi:3-hydroxyacyl-CoA dehydrogenase